MDINGRVVMGFPGSNMGSIVLDDSTRSLILNHDIPFKTTGNLSVLGFSNVAAEIRRLKRETPVPPSAVSSCNIVDNSIDPKLAFFDSRSLSVLNGGTGQSNVPPGYLLLGGADGSTTSPSNLVFSSSNLYLTGDLDVSGNKFSVDEDIFGNTTLFVTDAAGSNADLIAAGRRNPSVSDVSWTLGTREVTFDVTFGGNDTVPRTVHSAWDVSPSPDRTKGDIIGSGYAARVYDGGARFTATRLTGSHYDFRIVSKDSRGNVSDVYKVTLSNIPSS